tara:strand:+ start:177 stop:494 length:318 start_codon:yes stop_codon:yes gene_type:complete
MDLAELLIFLLGNTGITIIIVLSYLLEPVREFLFSKSKFLEKLLSCTMCTGFWVGAISSIWFGINPVFAAGAVSLLSWVTSSIIDCFGAVNIYFESLIEDGENDE